MIGRFQVMAVLQTARAYLLGKDLDEAKSFGLNRAIFYAVAKRGFKGKKSLYNTKKFKIPHKVNKYVEIKGKNFEIERVGDEIAYAVNLGGKRYYVMGDQIQTPELFERQIERRFNGHFEKAFKEAIRICKKYDKGILLSQRSFYEIVYKPRRDELKDKWNEKFNNFKKEK